jgi:hypothetical protein
MKYITPSKWMPPRWAPDLRADEPPHGLLLRLSDLNGIARMAMMRTMTGVSCRRVRFGQELPALASIAHCDLGLLEQAAYRRIRGESIHIRGESIQIRGHELRGSRDVLTASRRVCPECLNESLHHRFWWDLAFLETCPWHERRLVSQCSCGGKLSWEDGLLTKCRDCKDGTVFSVLRETASREILALDRRILAQFGLWEGIETPSELQNVPLTQAIDAIERIAALDLHGYAVCWVEIDDLSMQRAAARAHGFKVILENRVGDALDRTYEGFLSSHSGRQATMVSAYGWFYGWLSWRGGENFSPPLAQIVLDNALQKFQVQRGVFPSLPRDSPNVTLTEAARECRVRPGTLRKILNLQDGIRAEKRKGSPVKVSKETLAAIKADLELSVRLEGLPQILGVGVTMVKLLIRAKILPIWVPMGVPGGKSCYLLRRPDIEEWLERLVGNAGTVSRIDEGQIPIADAPNALHVKAVTLVTALMEQRVQCCGRVSGAPGLAGILVRISDVRPLASLSVRKAPYRKRGPYKKR